MRALRLGAVFLGSALAVAGCGATHETAGGHEAEATTPAPPPPTPDTTPVEALRTPAGIALKPVESAVTPAPAAK